MTGEKEFNAKNIGISIVMMVTGRFSKLIKQCKRVSKKCKKRTLLRGVNESHYGYEEATYGRVGGSYWRFLMHSTYTGLSAEEHNSGGDSAASQFTSWTTKRKVADHFTTCNRGKRTKGVIITARIATFRIFKSPNQHKVITRFGTTSEKEFLVIGPVQGIPTFVNP